jgi:hypothetical protein
MLWILVIAAGLITVHELGHILATVVLGGRFKGLVFRGFALGVKLDLSRLTLRDRLSTVWAGIGAETLAVLGLGVLEECGVVNLHLFAWATLVLAIDAFLNLGPWWKDSDGSLIRRWQARLRHGHA